MYLKIYTLCHITVYTVYIDFESFLTPHSVNVSHHILASFCYDIVDWMDKAVKEPVLYRGENVVDTFLFRLLKDDDGLNRKIKRPLNMTKDEET